MLSELELAALLSTNVSLSWMEGACGAAFDKCLNRVGPRAADFEGGIHGSELLDLMSDGCLRIGCLWN